MTDATYSPYGELLRQTLSAGGKFALITRTYEEGTRRLARSVVQRETAPTKVTDVAYKYDAAGNVSSITDATSSDTQCFEVDYLRRLREAWTPATDCAAPRSAQALGATAPYWTSYRYDKTGNRIEEVRHAGAGDTTSKYDYAGHKLLSVQTTGLAGSRTDAYGYDSAGNTTSRKIGADAQALEWNAGGKLTKVTKGDQTTGFVYDTEGRRLLRRDPAGSTLYLGGTEIRQDTAGKVSATRYYTHGGVPVAMRTSSGVTWLSADHHGTGDVAITATDQKVTRRRTTPFGEERGAPSGWPSERGFLDGTGDPSTGLTHLGAREYDPKTGRFISADPLVNHNDPQQMNGYSYANGNPVTTSDPTGLMPCTDKEECDYYREHEQQEDQRHDTRQRKQDYERGRGSSSNKARQGGTPARIKPRPQLYIQLPCIAASMQGRARSPGCRWWTAVPAEAREHRASSTRRGASSTPTGTPARTCSATWGPMAPGGSATAGCPATVHRT
ncbi:MAG: RHS repeat-associated core domain-containing protein [Umezawaea sp.]